MRRETEVPNTKDCPARVKAAGVEDGLEPGQFTALVAVFGNRDSVGDVIQPGAFTDTLKEWSSIGDPIPVIWSHDWSDPFSHIGSVVKAEETPDGLLVTGQLDTEEPKAAKVYNLLKGRRVTQFSFAYDIVEGAWVEPENDQPYYELRKLKLHEVGPTLVGANQETELIAAKAQNLVDGAKAGRVLSQKNFKELTAAYESIGKVLEAATPEKEPEKSGTPTEEIGRAHV
jgi:HK97 family phage prohead protease